MGDITIRGITRPGAIDAAYFGLATDLWGNERAMFWGRTEIDRGDFDVTWNPTLESGGVLIGRKLGIVLEVQAKRWREASA